MAAQCLRGRSNPWSTLVSIEVVCSGCGHDLQLSHQMKGVVFDCPQCGKPMIVPYEERLDQPANSTRPLQSANGPPADQPQEAIAKSPAAPPPPPQNRPEFDPRSIVINRSQPAKDSDDGWKAFLGCGAILAIFLGLCFLGSFFLNSNPSDAMIREQLVAGWSRILNENPQRVFNAFHPVGTASHVEVHDVQPALGQGGQKLWAIRFTIFWRGPVQTDGYTTVVTYFDVDSKRNVGTEVLSTNGITNQQAGEFALEFTTGFLEELARQEAVRRQYGN